MKSCFDDGGWRFVKKDNAMVMIGSCPNAIPPSKLGDHSYFAYLVVDNVDEYYAEIAQRNVQLFCKPENQPWGMREFGLATPDGHRIMMAQVREVSNSG